MATGPMRLAFPILPASWKTGKKSCIGFRNIPRSKGFPKMIPHRPLLLQTGNTSRGGHNPKRSHPLGSYGDPIGKTLNGSRCGSCPSSSGFAEHKISQFRGLSDRLFEKVTEFSSYFERSVRPIFPRPPPPLDPFNQHCRIGSPAKFIAKKQFLPAFVEFILKELVI